MVVSIISERINLKSLLSDYNIAVWAKTLYSGVLH